MTRADNQRRYRANHPGRAAEQTAKWKYGITAEEYNRLFDEQQGVCLICKRPETTRDPFGRVRTRLSVDHNHETGAIRGLVCHHCNAAMGHANDDPALLRQMADYLEAS